MHIKIKVESFPLHFIVLGGILLVYSIFDLIAGQSYILDTILVILGVLLITSHQRVVIDLKNKKYSEFYWVLGLKMSNYEQSYQQITSLVCATGKYSQQYGKYNRRFISGTMYSGYIELKDQENIFIGQHKSKASLMKKLAKIGSQLNITIEEKFD